MVVYEQDIYNLLIDFVNMILYYKYYSISKILNTNIMC